jgi:DMSO/TMAO reductase YedYZ molybdopterin-dependent catalytic subunit
MAGWIRPFTSIAREVTVCSPAAGFGQSSDQIFQAYSASSLRSMVIEVVFFGTDRGEVTIRDIKMQQDFARSMSLADATNSANLLCYEMNGAALPEANGAPLRLIAPGWYGIANVKWLKRIEVRDTRYMSLLMARDYVTIREEQHNGETVWTETSVGRARIKSAPAKVTRKDSDYRIIGAAWGAPIERVEVQIDQGPWTVATPTRSDMSNGPPIMTN